MKCPSCSVGEVAGGEEGVMKFNALVESNRPWWLDAIFDRYRWYRKRCGGHWERWWIDVINSEQWLQVQQCTHTRAAVMPESEARPPLARGTPTCEDYPKKCICWRSKHECLKFCDKM